LKKSEERLRGILVSREIIVNKEENPYWRAYYSTGYGKSDDNKLILHPIEALHLLDNKKIIIVNENGENIDRKKLINLMVGDKNAWPTYIIYKDLRQRGYSIKLVNKYPIVIDIYPRGLSPIDSDPSYSVMSAEASKEINLGDLDTAIDICKERKTQLVIGIVDELGDVTYYKVLEVLEVETKLKIYQKKK